MPSDDIEELIASNSLVIEINVSDPKLQLVETNYQISTVPYLIVL